MRGYLRVGSAVFPSPGPPTEVRRGRTTERACVAEVVGPEALSAFEAVFRPPSTWSVDRALVAPPSWSPDRDAPPPDPPVGGALFTSVLIPARDPRRPGVLLFRVSWVEVRAGNVSRRAEAK